MNNRTIFSLISSNRKALLGLSMLWILIYHSDLQLIPPFNYIKANAYGFVDMFIFLSGFGIFCSLSKDNNLWSFYKKRIKRIIPAYYVVLFLDFIKETYINYNYPSITRLWFVANAIFISYPFGIGKAFNWYVYAIVYFYLLSPLFYKLIKNKHQYICIYIGSILLNLLFIKLQNPGMMYIVSRLFIFVLGMQYANLGIDHSEENTKQHQIPILIMSLVIGLFLLFYTQTHYSDYLVSYGLYFYPMILIVPPLVVFVSLCLSKIKKQNPIILVLNFLGAASFEIYLVNACFKSDIIRILVKYLGWRTLMWLSLILISIILGYLLKIVINFISKMIKLAIKNT